MASRLRVTVAAAALLSTSATLGHAQTAPAATAPAATPPQLVDALYGVFGRHPHARAVHAKGIVLEGTFAPSPEAASISRAPHLQATSVPEGAFTET